MNVQLNLQETYQDIMPARDEHSIQNSVSAFCSIQRGCSNRCSFCIVPFTRGQERSRPLESIVAEVQQLVTEQNIQEIVLLGQNVNSYHDQSESAMMARPMTTLPGLSNDGFKSRFRRDHLSGGYTFVDLVEHISDISPELRVRFTSPHPKDYPTELLHCMAERPNVCNQLHLPAQSGSTSMLKRMKRGYTRDAYLELVDTVRSIIPDVALSSDFIAGFCGETIQEHDDTVSLLEQVEYEQAFLFAYSMREKTHAHRTMQDNVPANIKQARLQQLIDTFRSHVHAKNERVEIGKLRLVLVEGPAKRQLVIPNDGNAGDGDCDDNNNNNTTLSTWHGRTDQNKRIMFSVQQENTNTTVANNNNLNASMMMSAMAMDSTVALSKLTASGVHIPSFVVPPSSSLSHAANTKISPGEYAVVEVTEAKGHTLRGRMLWKTSLTDFAMLESHVLSKLNTTQMNAFKTAI